MRRFQAEIVDSVILLLHGNPIARYPVGAWRDLQVCDGGWTTVTTKDRLNGIPGVSVYQRKGAWFLNGVEWDGSWTPVYAQFNARERTDGKWVVTRFGYGIEQVFNGEAEAKAYAVLANANFKEVA